MINQSSGVASMVESFIKHKGLLLGLLVVVVLWHVFLAWGAYNGTVVKPEDYPGIRPCIANYGLADLQEVGGVDENLDKAREIAIWNGYQQPNGQVHWKVIHNILISQFGYSSEMAMNTLESVQKFSDPQFLKCRSIYRSATFEYEIEKSGLEKGHGWEKSSRFLYVWSQLAIGKFDRFMREIRR